VAAVRENAFPPAIISLVIIVAVKVELIRERVAVGLPGTCHGRETNTVCDTHRPNTCGINLLAALLNFAFWCVIGAVDVSGLVSRNLVEKGLESTLGNMELAFILPLLVVPCILLLGPLVVNSL
jgi:hypothetical protein